LYWKSFVAGADALAVDERLLVVSTPLDLRAFGLYTGEQQWSLGGIESSGRSWIEVRDGYAVYWGDASTIWVDVVTGKKITQVDEPFPQRRARTCITLNGYTLRNTAKRMTIDAAADRQWEIEVPEPFFEESPIVSKGTWAWFCLGDGRLYGIDLGSDEVRDDLDALVADSPILWSSSPPGLY